MAFKIVKQDGNYVVGTNDKGITIFKRTGTLQGYTADSVTIIEGKMLKTYSETGKTLASSSVK